MESEDPYEINAMFNDLFLHVAISTGKGKLMKKYQLKVGREGQSESLNLALATVPPPSAGNRRDEA